MSVRSDLAAGQSPAAAAPGPGSIPGAVGGGADSRAVPLPRPAPGPAATPADAPGVVALMTRVIARLDARLAAGQRSQLAAAMPAILWEFPDHAARVTLEATPDSLRCVAAGQDVGLVVRMPLEALDAAASGRRSLAASFLAGRIAVRGMGPARLREFMLLVEPLLESYREATLEHTLPAAAAAAVS